LEEVGNSQTVGGIRASRTRGQAEKQFLVRDANHYFIQCSMPLFVKHAFQTLESMTASEPWHFLSHFSGWFDQREKLFQCVLS
jgi:hypothetical protein